MRGLELLLLTSLVGIDSLASAQTTKPTVSNAAFESVQFSGDLQAQIRSAQPAWFAYTVESIRKEDDGNCCWTDERRGCGLESDNKNIVFGTRPETPIALEGSKQMLILLREEGGTVQKIRSFSPGCPLDAGGLRFVWISDVPATASLTLLKPLASSSTGHLSDGAIMAIAQHAAPAADDILAGLANPENPVHTREQVSFWSGASRGAKGTVLLQRMLTNDPDERVRDKAIFGLSLSKVPQALDTLVEEARHDPSAHIREQALFWLAQKAGKRAADTIQNAIQNDPDTEVKRKAVFALSQLPKDEGVPKLISVAQTQRNPEVRKQAFFWLGQSHDPRALAYIEQVLGK